MIKLLRRLLLGVRLELVQEVAGAGGGPLIANQTCRYIALSTDVMPGLDRSLPVQAGDGCHLINTALSLTWDGAWWRNGRNFASASRGIYSERQRPRVSIAPPTNVRVDGGSTITLDSTTLVPNDTGAAINATGIDTYAWTASPAVGVFANAATADTTWTAPAAAAEEQRVTLKLTVTEDYTAALGGNITGEAEIEITVNAA